MNPETKNPVDLSLDQALSQRFDALYQWLSRKYQLGFQTLKIGERQYGIYKIDNIDTVLDQVIENFSHPNENAPYWADLWASGIALGEFLSKKRLIRKSALGLGSGVGVAEMAARHQGAIVILSDNQEDALRLAELNWIANFGESPQLIKLDWRYPHLEQQFDLLIASDVAYEQRLFMPLIETFRKLLKPDGELYLSEPNRTGAGEFFALLKNHGFELERFSQRIFYKERETDISIYRISRSR